MSGANSPYLDGLFQLTAFLSGTKIGTSAQANFSDAFTLSYNDTTKRFDFGIASSPVVTWDAVVAALKAGGVTLQTGTLTTTNATTGTLMSIPLADNAGYIALMMIQATTTSGGNTGIYQYSHMTKITIIGGVVSATNDASIGTTVDTYVTPLGGPQPSTWSGGNLAVKVQGEATTNVQWKGLALIL